MIDRRFLPRYTPMRRWPDWDTASIGTICAPLSGDLHSPRGNRHDGKGMAFTQNVRDQNEQKRLALRRLGPRGPRGPRSGKWT